MRPRRKQIGDPTHVWVGLARLRTWVGWTFWAGQDRVAQLLALRVHANDIEKFQPGFVWDGAAPGHTAYLVERGAETVGVVLVRDAGNGVAQVVLDYVTPRFRDFSPGEFVYRRSGLFHDRGFRKVVTPAGMVAPYYERLGMRRDGVSYVMDID